MSEAAAAETRATVEAQAYCPHCFLLVESGVEGAWPPQPTRCPHCRLMIGPGRARPTAEASPGLAAPPPASSLSRPRTPTRAASTARPRTSRRRSATWPSRLGFQPERLLMVDYQQEAATDESLPTLTDVFACFGSWKRARREAAASR